MNYLGIMFEKELNIKEKEIIKYLIDNGYEISNIKQYDTKMKMDLTKDNITIPYDFYKDITDIVEYCKLINESFELTRRLRGYYD